jgi:hypothetical protein
VAHAAGGRMSEEADLLDEYEALVMDNDEVIQ